MKRFRGWSIALVAAALASPAIASAQTGTPPPSGGGQDAPVGMSDARFAAQVTSLLEGSPPARLGRAWAEVVAEVRQRLDALDRAAAAAGAAATAREPLPAVDVDEPEVLSDEPGAGEPITDENETVIRRWGGLHLFAEPIVVQERSTTFGRWDSGVLPGLGIRFPGP